jgi:hypothetical protein
MADRPRNWVSIPGRGKSCSRCSSYTLIHVNSLMMDKYAKNVAINVHTINVIVYIRVGWKLVYY